MTGGSDEIVVFMYLGNVGGLVYGLFQFFQICTVLGTDANLAEYTFGLSVRQGVGVVVYFIPDDDNFLIGINGVDCSSLFFVKGVFVGQPEYDGRLLKFLECSFNSKKVNSSKTIDLSICFKKRRVFLGFSLANIFIFLMRAITSEGNTPWIFESPNVLGIRNNFPILKFRNR